MIECTLSLVADHAQADSGGKLYIVGEFRYMYSKDVPVYHPHFSVVGRWQADTVAVRDRENSIEIEIVDQDGNPIAPRSPKLPLKFSSAGKADYGKSQAVMIANLQGLMLQKHGEHVIHFIVNDAHCGRVAFYLSDVPSGSPA